MRESRAAAEKHLLIVGGPGRSGTSLVTGLINRLGYYIPQPELSANANNPRGFGESVWPLRFHKRLMASAGVRRVEIRPSAIERVVRAATQASVQQELAAWLTEQFEIADRVVIKDPRLLWFVDLYRGAAEATGARFGLLTMVRHPAETLHSATTRDRTTNKRIPALVRTAGWINGSLTIERASRGVPRAFVSYDALMDDWRKALTATEHPLGIALISSAAEAQLDDATELLDRSLHRSRPDWAGMRVPAGMRSMANRTFEAMLALAADPGDEGARRGLDGLSKRYRTDIGTRALALAWTRIEAILAPRGGAGSGRVQVP